MSQSQAEIFATTYTVIDQFTDPVTGFSATVFARSGVNYFAIRGTETGVFSGAVDWLTNVADVSAEGIAVRQGIALFNYLQRLYGAPGQVVVQYTYDPLSRTIGTATGTASGLLSGQLAPLSVTGHSLGGHLAMMLSRLAPSLVSAVYTYNAPGFDTALRTNLFPLTSEGFFNLLRNAPIGPITGPIGTAWNSGVMTHLDVEGDVVHDIGNTPGIQQVIFSESANQGPVDAHDKVPLTDALAVYKLFATVALDASISAVTDILKASASTANKSLESTLDALRTLFQEDYTLGTPDPNAVPTPVDDRDSFYTNVFSLRSYLENLPSYDSNTKSLGHSVESLVGQSTTALFNTAQSDIATRYALYKLNPFVIRNADDLYSAINNSSGALDVYSPATGTGSLTEQYLRDRSAFLVNKIWSGANDQTTVSGDALALRNSGKQYFDDRATGYRLYLGEDRFASDVPASGLNQIKFGSVNTDTLTGGDTWDKLYGMAGDDTLQGNKGNDHLEGGQGTDTYLYNPGDGLDTLLDTDGSGKIRFDGAILTGGDKLFGETYKSSDGNYLYTLLQKATGKDLLISGMGGQIIIKDFQSGELGINLNGGTSPAPTSEFHGTANHDADLVDSGAPVGAAGGGVLDTNWQNYAAYGQVLYHDPALDVGGMYFLSRLGQPYPANTVFDALYGGGGDDYLLGNPGGHDFLLDGGAGNDWIVADYNFSWQAFRASTDYAALSTGVTISGGDGNDAILGGLQGDAIDAGAGHDQVFADPDGEVGTANGEDYIEGGSGNDWLSGGKGADVIFGGPDVSTEADNDTLLGGAESDYLEGGAGDDTLYGDTDGGFVRQFVNVGDGSVHLIGWNGATQRHIIPDFHDSSPVTLSFLQDVTDGEAGDDYLDGGAGNDRLFGGAGDDLLDGGADNDKLYGEAGDDELIGGAGDDKLWGDLDNAVYNQDQQISETHGTLRLFNREYAAGFDAEGNDLLDGGAGNDEMRGGGGDDILKGGEGNDKLIGGAGADILDGDVGDDIIYRDEFDTVVFRPGDGHDTVTSAAGGRLIIEGITSDALQLGQTLGNDGSQYLTIAYGSGDQITIQNGLLDLGQTYEFGTQTLTQRGLLQYAPAVTVVGTDAADALVGGNRNDILVGNAGADTLEGQRGNDGLDGGLGNDTYVFNAGDGQDTITDYDPTAGNADTLRFGAGIREADLRLEQTGNDLIVRIGGTTDRLTVTGWTEPGGANRIERFEFSDGGVWDQAAIQNRVSAAVTGDQSLTGTAGDDVLVGGAGDDSLYGQGGNDRLVGRAGNDFFLGGPGDDTYVFESGDGQDDIAERGGTDTILFGPGIAPDDIRIVATPCIDCGSTYFIDERIEVGNNGDVIRTSRSGGLIIGPASDGEVIERFAFADGTSYSYDEMLARQGGLIVRNAFGQTVVGSGYLLGTTGNDVINTVGGTNTVNAGAGDDTITSRGNDLIHTGSGNNNVYLAGRQASGTAGVFGAVTVIGGSGNDTYHVTHYPSGSLVVGSPRQVTIVDIARPGAGNVLRFGGSIQFSSISFGLGSLAIRMNQDSEVHLPNFDPNDVFGVHAIDTFEFDDGTVLSYAEFVSQGFDIDGTEQDDALSGTNITDRIRGFDGNDAITSGDGDDTLTGGAGNDDLSGGNGHDTYVFSLGGGVDTVHDISTPTGANLLAFGAGVSRDSIYVEHSDDTLVLHYGALGDAVRLSGFSLDNNLVAGRVQFSDGTVFDITELLNRPPVLAIPLADQETPEDSLFSFEIPANAFVDPDLGDVLSYSVTLEGGGSLPSWLGFDALTHTLSGMPGNDDIGGIAITVTATDLAGTSVSDDFTITINNVNDAPVLANALADQTATEGETFNYMLTGNTFHDDDLIHGDVLTYTATQTDGSAIPAWLTFDAATQTFIGAAPTDSTLIGTDGDDVLADTDTGISGIWDIQVTATDAAGVSASDTFTLTLQGVPGNDTLQGGKGNDVLNGGGGDDTYIYNLGDGLDTLTDYAGQDTVSFGTGFSFDNTIIRVDSATGTAHLRFLDDCGCETEEGMDIALNPGGSSPIEAFVFADGTAYTLADLALQQKTW